ncbi:branched-chain amino acid transport system permease protein [Desulfotomaculum arcticum]|uniref:Branched-chain amino acid transport system permease protein n=1 Tax=Desulfotruncus arcticus DSM 17038 TaxID=1121424 RepID=A0A1I2PRV9_9FIRM|nr:branched-chain amino acid ABC transporter permease [Desulfotruncus arcticus]SFG16346.1 branched-chain amino acid transport system permease protein [Desulfotomaculum arcticum] [Desulfotruncus arcticus DSM 17038]
MNKSFLWPAVILLFFALPLVIDSNYLLSVLIVIGLYTIIVQGLGILMGYAGQVSFGHGGFFGLGGYAVAIMTTRYDWPPLLALLAAIILPGLIAAVIGRPTLKLRELYLALGTMGFGILIHTMFNEARELTGGPSGIAGIPYLSIGGLTFDNDLKFFYLVWVVVLLVLLGINNLIRSRMGRALRAVSESEHAAETAGIDTSQLKLKAFIFSALLAGLAGGLYAFYITFVSPAPFGFNISVQFVLMAVVGGLGTFLGPLLGAALVVLLGELLRWAIPLVIPGAGGEYEIIFFGLILVVLMIYRPEGLGSFGQIIKSPAAKTPAVPDAGLPERVEIN